jgi:hypothetical protein
LASIAASWRNAQSRLGGIAVSTLKWNVRIVDASCARVMSPARVCVRVRVRHSVG